MRLEPRDREWRMDIGKYHCTFPMKPDQARDDLLPVALR
jgi:hypothetical protein